MKIIIDSNVLFSALIRDSFTRRLILEYGKQFLFPEFIFEEMEKHKDELFRKSGMTTEDLNQLLQLIIKKILIVPNSILIPYREEALEIIKEIDIDDVLFIACALAYPNSILWSNDKDLKKQNKVTVLSTAEIIKVL